MTGISHPGVRRWRKSVAVALFIVAGTAVADGAVMGATADAATGPTVGELTFYPGKGLDTSPMYLITARPCPAAATHVSAVVNGKGFPAQGQIVLSNGTAGISRTDRFIEPLQDTMNSFASQLNIKLAGPYTVTLKCQNKFGDKVYGQFVGVMKFSDAAHFTAKETKLNFGNPGGAGGPSPAASGSTQGAQGGAAGGGAQQPPGAQSTDQAPNVAGQDTNAGSANGLVRQFGSGSSSRWLFLAVGLVLLVLAIALLARDRMSRNERGSHRSNPHGDQDANNREEIFQ